MAIVRIAPMEGDFAINMRVHFRSELKVLLSLWLTSTGENLGKEYGMCLSGMNDKDRTLRIAIYVSS